MQIQLQNIVKYQASTTLKNSKSLLFKIYVKITLSLFLRANQETIFVIYFLLLNCKMKWNTKKLFSFYFNFQKTVNL